MARDKNNNTWNVSEFLNRCRESSNGAYDGFKETLALLEEPATRRNARKFLADLIDTAEKLNEEEKAQVHFTFLTIPLTVEERELPSLKVLQLPSTFTPEEWSYTFFEGLSRLSATEFEGQIVAEVGCGNGWITLAQALRVMPKKIYGVDLNPRAIVAAKINLYINGLTPEGEPIVGTDGISLLDRVEFAESDLLSFFRLHKIYLDCLLACIPQVLSPSALDLSKRISERDSDELLYALSNYYVDQGYLEDKFGLGLIARALEETILQLNAGGKVLMNIGGRPGSTVIRRLFERRGYQVQEVWKTKVHQAGDTEIDPLVKIERESAHRFEFYLNRFSNEPISASTAQAYSQGIHPIYHALTVYEATVPYLARTKRIISRLRDTFKPEVMGALDLISSSEEITEERISFLNAFSEYLGKLRYFGYQETAGEPELRQRLAEYLSSYFQLGIGKENLFAMPGRKEFLHNMIYLYQPDMILIDRQHASSINRVWLQDIGADGKAPEIFEVPLAIEDSIEIIQRLRPQLIITALPEEDRFSKESVARLIDCCQETGSHLLLDISDLIDLSSSPTTNGVFRYMSDHVLPRHVAVFCGLVRNQVYHDLSLAFVLTGSRRLLDRLERAAELTYSRVPLIAQRYYGEILRDLLYFRRGRAGTQQGGRRLETMPESDLRSSSRLELMEHCEQAFRHPAIADNYLPFNHNTVRMDYGENTLPTPEVLKEGLLRAFLLQPEALNAQRLEEELRIFVCHRFGVPTSSQQHILLSEGVAPLFASLLEIIRSRRGTIFFPAGAYGYFVAAADFYNITRVVLPTDEHKHFKLSPEILKRGIGGKGNSWLFLNMPVINPTGALYTTQEITELLRTCADLQCNVIADTSFSGLEFEEAAPCFAPELFELFSRSGVELLLLGGISKEFAAAGLRFGFGMSATKSLHEELRLRSISGVHATIRYAVTELYRHLNHNNRDLFDHLRSQCHLLRQRAERLSACLTRCEWGVLPPAGGLFLVATPRAYFGKQIVLAEAQITLTNENIAATIFSATGLAINGSEWTGIPGYCRFVLSVSEAEFEAGLEKIAAFYELIGRK